MKYTYKHSAHWVENEQIIEQELQELTSWLHSSEIDPEFDAETHVYATEQGDRWLFLPQLTRSQLFAMSLILCSSELYEDNQFVKFDKPPNTETEDDLTQF